LLFLGIRIQISKNIFVIWITHLKTLAMKRIAAFTLFVLVLNPSCIMVPEDMRSPDGRISVQLGTNGDEAFTYSVYKENQLMVGSSGIELEFRNQDAFTGGLDMELTS
jgi:hypothetical protein